MISKLPYKKYLHHIMDAALHANIPGALESNSIFMSALRMKSLFDSRAKTLLSVQENDFLEFVMKDIIDAQGFATFQENFDSFMNLVIDKTVGENAIWTSGNKAGYLWKLRGESILLPFLELRSQYLAGDLSAMDWNFVAATDNDMFIGSLLGDLRVEFHQLGIRGANSIISGDSGGELQRQLSFQFYMEGDNYIRLYPGEARRNSEGVVIGGSRFCSIKTQFVSDLTNQDSLEMDTVVHLSDLLDDPTNRVDDAGRSFIVGIQGMHTVEHNSEKIRKIKEIQDKGGAYISAVQDNEVLSLLMAAREEIRTTDPGFDSVFLMKALFDKFIYTQNNPAHYHEKFEWVVNEIARQGYLYTDAVSMGADPTTAGETFSYDCLTGAECAKIAEAFGKYVVNTGEILDVRTREDFRKWWDNFNDSNIFRPAGTYCWYNDQARILRSRLFLLRDYYAEIGFGYTPQWVIDLGLQMEWGILH